MARAISRDELRQAIKEGSVTVVETLRDVRFAQGHGRRGVLAARQGARQLQLDDSDDLDSRSPPDYDGLGHRGRIRVGLRRHPRAVQTQRGQRARRGHLPRRGSANRLRQPFQPPAGGGAQRSRWAFSPSLRSKAWQAPRGRS